MKKSSMLFFSLLSIAVSSSVSAFEFRPVSESTQIRNIDRSKPFDLLDKVVAPAVVSSYIGFNEQVGTLYFKIGAKKRSKIKLQYDSKSLLFSQFIDPEGIIINSPGDVASISFTVFGPTSGHIKVLNEKNQLLKTIAYVVHKERQYRQSVRANISTSKAASSADDANNTSLSYSISKKTIHSADPYWNLDASVGTNIDNPEERTASVGFSYSW